MAGVFASTVAAPRPTADVDKETEKKFMFASQQIFFPQLSREPDEQ